MQILILLTWKGENALKPNPQWQKGVFNGCEAKETVRESELTHRAAFSLHVVFQRGLERSAAGHASAPFRCPSRCPWLGIHFRDIRKRVDERAHTTKVVAWETTQTLCDFTLVNITMLVSLFLKREENAPAFNFTHLRSCALNSLLRTKRPFQDGWCASIIL